jgi:hypothetical protein
LGALVWVFEFLRGLINILRIDNMSTIPDLDLGPSAQSLLPDSKESSVVNCVASQTAQTATTILSCLRSRQPETQALPPMLAKKTKKKLLGGTTQQDVSDRIKLIVLIRFALSKQKPIKAYVQELLSRGLMTQKELFKEFSNMPQLVRVQNK